MVRCFSKQTAPEFVEGLLFPVYTLLLVLAGEDHPIRPRAGRLRAQRGHRVPIGQVHPRVRAVEHHRNACHFLDAP